jgi:hypothetical protein
MKNEQKIKFPLSVGIEVDFPDLEFSENFQIKEIKEKIDSSVSEISSTEKRSKKNKSKKLI